jgi:hypothetical protein
MSKSFTFILIALLVSSCVYTKSKKQVAKIIAQTPPRALTFPKLPQEMVFAGQKIALMDEDLRERLDREVLMTAYYQSAWVGAMKRAGRYFPMIERILKEEHIPNDFKYLAIIESNLQQAVSPVGAQGFWQFMPETANMYDLEISDEVDERLHIEKSTRAACRFLNDMYASLHDWVLAAAAYNRGIGGVQNDLEWQKAESYFDAYQNSETARYVFRILATKLIYENPEAYGYYPKEMEIYKPFKVKHIVVNESITNLSDWALEQGSNIKILRKLNPWLKTLKLTVRNKHYTLLLPTDGEHLKPYNAYH